MKISVRLGPLKILAAVLLAIFVLLQARLWLSDEGVRAVFRLRTEVHKETLKNAALTERVRLLRADVQDLKSKTSALEERARTDLGMIAPNETFYQVTAPNSTTSSSGGTLARSEATANARK